MLKTNPEKILFLGNSITLHGPKADIGWMANWGMAASALEKDYAHLLLQHYAETNHGLLPQAMIRNIADFERQYETFDARTELKESIEFQADIVILAIGENVAELSSTESQAKFKEGLSTLLAALKQDRTPAIVVRSSFWPNSIKDAILCQVCQEAGGTFVDISQLSQDETNYARSERAFDHDGVAAHPGDKGMREIASAIWKAITQ